MNSNRENATPEINPITWTRKKEWGSEGLTHRATAVAGDDTWKYVVLSPRKGEWRVTGSRNGTVQGFHAEARTLAEAKGLVQAHLDARVAEDVRGRLGDAIDNAAELLAEHEAALPDVVGTLPSGRAFVMDFKTGADRLPVRPKLVPCARCKDSGIDPEDSDGGHGVRDDSLGEPPNLEPCRDCGPRGAGIPEAPAYVLSPQQEGILTVLDGCEPTPEQQAAMIEASQRVGEFFRAVTQSVIQVTPSVRTAIVGLQRVRFALARRCDCPTPSHRMSCGEGGRVRVVTSGGAL